MTRAASAAAAAALLCLAGAAAPARAQAIRFDLRMEHASYLVGEHVTCRVSVGNVGTRPIVIDDFEAFRDNRLFFEISPRGRDELYPQIREGKIVGEMDLGRDEAEAFDVDLSEWYDLRKPAQLFVRAVLVCNGMRYESPTRSIDVVPGIEMARLVQFIPGTAPPAERTVRLVYWPRERRELAFLCASDSPSGVVWESLLLGDVVRVRKPSIVRDGKDAATFSVYRQATRDTLVRTVVESDAKGLRIVRQTRAVEAVSSPMVDSIREAVEKAPGK